MPLIEFICPDKERIKIEDCLKEGSCRMGNRCASRSYLRLVSRQRQWTGKPSTTQLISGTMQAFLKLTKDYAISPDQRAFMIHGTKGHGVLEGSQDELSLLEERFDGENVNETGISDFIETELNKRIMGDYKTSGSYKVAKALGFHVIDEDTGEIYKSGKRKGEKKMRKVLIRDDKYIDRWEWELQLNKYRIEYEKKYDQKIDEMRIQCCVRDGNTYIARSRGVFRNIYYFQIKCLSDEMVLKYFDLKRRALLQALKQGWWKHPCDASENWDGLKCASYCEVSEFCQLGKYLKREKEVENMAIKNLSNIRRLPRLGKIRLGIKKVTQSGKEYPAEVDYFILDPQTPSELENKKLIEEFHRLYGEQPKQIKIMLPLPDTEIVFPQDYKRYGQTAMLKCKGNGEIAYCGSAEYAQDLETLGQDDFGMVKVKCRGPECPYQQDKSCTRVGVLQVLLPELPGAGVWQIATGSFHSIVNLNSCLDYVKAICGRFHMIPLTLERREQDIQHDGKKRKHYILHINMAFALADLQKFAAIDATKILLELPEPEIGKEDILSEENPNVETTQIAKETKQENYKASEKVRQMIEYLEESPNAEEFQHRMGELVPEINKLAGKDKEVFIREKQNIELRFE